MKSILLSILILSCCLLAGACGKKGPVRPLEAKLPAPVRQLEARQFGNKILLSWSLPTKNQDGSPLGKEPQIDIFRMDYNPADDCPDCRDRSTLLVSIDPALPSPARKELDTYSFLDPEVRPGTGYQYRLTPRSSAGQAGQTATVRLPLTAPVPAPQLPAITVRDRSLALAWQPVEISTQQTLLGYQIYRWQKDHPAPLQPVNPAPLESPYYEDFDLLNGVSYHYQIRALIGQQDRVMESEPSPAITGTPQAAN